MEYDECLKIYRDNKNTWDYAIENGFREGQEKGYKEGIEKGIQKGIQKGILKGKKEGIEEGRITALREIAEKLKSQGMDVATIVACTGLDADTIAAL